MAEVTYFPAAELAWRASVGVRDLLEHFGAEVAGDARAHAPVGQPSHGGAASIHAETSLGPEGWEAEVSWDTAHYYMTFIETGTVHLPARPFLVPALERVRSL